MKFKLSIRTIVLAIIALASTSALSNPQSDHEAPDESYSVKTRSVTFDVAESMPKFIFDEAPLLPSGLPAYGNPFITQGYIYPTGTLNSSNGVLADGSPEFPDLVIGEWTCRGYFIGNGAETQTGPWVITTQLYDFYADSGYIEGKQGNRNTLISEGYEIADIGVMAPRAITGGTGRYRLARGQAKQTLLGFNTSEGVNLRFTIRTK
jgi:hypothetical protein